MDRILSQPRSDRKFLAKVLAMTCLSGLVGQTTNRGAHWLAWVQIQAQARKACML